MVIVCAPPDVLDVGTHAVRSTRSTSPSAARSGSFLEGYAVQFDGLFGSLAQQRGFGSTWRGLLASRDRNKTLTALAGAEPVAGAGHPAVQLLHFF